MKNTFYLVTTAAHNVFRDRWVNLMTMFSMAVGLFLIGLFAVSLWSLRIAVNEWAEGFGIVVYLEDGFAGGDLKALEARIRRQPEVGEVTYKSPAEALDALKRELGPEMLEGLDENPLPATFEVKLREDRVDAVTMERLAGRIGTMNGVAEVQFGERWVGKVTEASNRLNLFGLALILCLGFGITFMLSNTVRVLFHRRNEEIEIQKLLGATRSFIRLPFLLEGALLGGLSGLVASSALGSTFTWLTTTYLLLGFVDYPRIAGAAVVTLVGILLGIFGSLTAIGRIRL